MIKQLIWTMASIPFVKVLHLLYSLQVWASKWNERAFISCRKANLYHNNLCMAILIQEIIRGDYSFVIHTKNPLSGDNSEIYTEVIQFLPLLFSINDCNDILLISFLGGETDCERLRGDFGGCLSWPSYELYCQKEQSKISYCKADFSLNLYEEAHNIPLKWATPSPKFLLQ